jgi:hypothetical protein
VLTVESTSPNSVSDIRYGKNNNCASLGTISGGLIKRRSGNRSSSRDWADCEKKEKL